MENEINNNETAKVSNKALKVKRLTPAATVLLTLLFVAIGIIVASIIMELIK